MFKITPSIFPIVYVVFIKRKLKLNHRETYNFYKGGRHNMKNDNNGNRKIRFEVNENVALIVGFIVLALMYMS